MPYYKIEFVLKLLESRVGKLISTIPDETLYSAILNILNLAGVSDEKVLKLIDILSTIKPEGTWASWLTDGDNIKAVRELLADFKDLSRNRIEEIL